MAAQCFTEGSYALVDYGEEPPLWHARLLLGGVVGNEFCDLHAGF